MVSVLTDLRLALRMIRRRPALAVAIVLPIASAIAINSALFSVTDGLLFRSLPFDRPSDLVALEYRRVGDTVPELAYLPALQGERDRIRAALDTCPLVEGVAEAGVSSSLEPGARELGLQVTGVDSRFFQLLGLRPVIGTDFGSDDEVSPALARDSALPVPVIIDHGLWVRMFGADPKILRVREFAGRRVRIVGVMGPGVKFPNETNVWVPLRTAFGRPPAYARLARPATIEQLAARFPALEIRPLAEAVRPGGSRQLLVLFGGACLLLLVAWVQVGALVFAGAIGRFHELGVRLAIGGGRLRLVRQFASENALLAFVAFGLAWVAVRPLTTFIVSMLPHELSRGQYLEPDARTFLFGCGASLLGVGILTTLPVAVIRRTSPLQLLQGGVREGSFSAERLRHGLLVAQVALTAVLLYLAGLTAHSFLRAASFDYGFDSKNVMLFTPPLPPLPPGADLSKYHSGDDPVFHARFEEQRRRIAESLQSLDSARGVVAAASFFQLPLVTRGSRSYTTVPGAPRHLQDEVFEFDGRSLVRPIRVQGNSASRDFVRALGARLVAGRSFDDPEHAGVDKVVVINETLAKQLVPPVNVEGVRIQVPVLGRTISLRKEGRGFRIVGVIRDLVYATPAAPAVGQYFRRDHTAGAAAVVAIRTTPSVDAASPVVHGVLERIWDDLPPKHFTLLRDAWHEGLLPFRSKAILLGAIAVLCVPLAAIGLVGALLYSVQVRTRETAIRIALGADPAAVQRAVVGKAMTMVAAGALIGSALGGSAGRAISHQLFNVRAADPWTMVAVAATLSAVAWLAALVPARRASRTDPAAALQHD